MLSHAGQAERGSAEADGCLPRREVHHSQCLGAYRAEVPFVAEHVVKGNGRPFAAISGRDACFIQFFADCRKPLAIQVRFEDAFDYSRFFRDDLQLPVDPFVAITAEERRLTIFEFLADRPLAVFRNGKALFLREGCEDGQHQFTIGTDGVDVLFLKVKSIILPMACTDARNVPE